MGLPQRAFGKTGEKWPAMGMGCGFPWGFAGFDCAIDTVRRALEVGIQYFDTSVLYRSGASQAIVGEGLAGRSEKHFLATKIGYFKEASHFRSVEAMHVQLRESLRLLRRESVDLLQIHEADWDNWWTDRSDVRPGVLLDEQGSFKFDRAPVIQFLREAKEKGLCRHVGIAGNNARHLRRLIEEINGIDSVLVAYNYAPLNVTAREQIIPAAAKKGTAVIVAGIFTFVSRIPAGWRTEGTYFGKNADQQLARLAQLQKESGLPMEELALRFVAADERISTILVGACRPEEMEQNVASLMKGKLPGDLHQAAEGIAREFERLN